MFCYIYTSLVTFKTRLYRAQKLSGSILVAQVQVLDAAQNSISIEFVNASSAKLWDLIAQPPECPSRTFNQVFIDAAGVIELPERSCCG